MEVENIIVNSLDGLLEQASKKIIDKALISSRAGNTKELLGQKIVLTNPRNVWIQNPERKDNTLASIAETVWVLSGHRHLSWLTRFLPRAPDFSDDWNGTEGTWRAGYQRVVDFNYDGKINQVKIIYEELKKNPASRQAVISIWDPNRDPQMFGKSKDLPCNDLLQFIIRDNKLHLFVFIRSNDLLWGCSQINIREWTLLLRFMAAMLKVDLGYLFYNPTSLHVYESFFERLNLISDWYSNNDLYKTVSEPLDNLDFENTLTYEDFEGIIELLYILEIQHRCSSSDLLDNFNKFINFFEKYPIIMSTMSSFLLHKREEVESPVLDYLRLYYSSHPLSIHPVLYSKIFKYLPDVKNNVDRS